MFEILLYNVVLARVDSIRAVSLIIDSRARKLGVDPDIFETRYGEDPDWLPADRLLPGSVRSPEHHRSAQSGVD